MTSVRVVAAASIAFVIGVHPLFAQGLSRYRDYALESNVASIVKISRTRPDSVKTLHERPASIQELEWRTPYTSLGSEMADPVRDLLFSFYNDQLYQIVVTYDRDRMEGLTNADVIETISATYGVPLLRHSRTPGTLPPAVVADTAIVAQWEDEASLLTLTRGTYSSEIQLVLTSKTLTPRARAAIKEALRLDTQEAPRRELTKRNKEVADARVASEKARIVNKAAFKP